MTFTQSLEHVTGFASADGAKAADIIADLRQQKKSNSLPLLNLPARSDDLAEINQVAEQIGTQFSTLIVLGTGGSSLGGQTLCALTQNLFAPVQSGMALHFVDNIDPHTMQQLIATVDLSKTHFLIISKSGGTVETLSQMLIMLAEMKAKVGDAALAKHFTLITIPAESPMRALANQHGMRILDHDPKLGGRFSVLSNVGFIPARLAGLDLKALRAGAAEILDEALDEKNFAHSRAVQGAAASIAMMAKGKSISVLMPYCDRLACFGMWYRQLWAESIGKNGKGSTPVRALGTVDQHSQLQLYLDGPRDKFITLLLPDHLGKGPKIDASLARQPGMEHLPGRSIGDIIGAQQQATLETLVKNGCPVRVMRIPHLDEKTLGALLMHFMLETILAAGMLGINAYDQSAVEEGKVLAREYLLKETA